MALNYGVLYGYGSDGGSGGGLSGLYAGGGLTYGVGSTPYAGSSEMPPHPSDRHPSDQPHGFFGRLLRNIGGDITDIVTGVPRAGLLVGKAVAVANPIALAAYGLDKAGVDAPFGSLELVDTIITAVLSE